VRGTPLMVDSCLTVRRFIPAGAGNTFRRSLFSRVTTVHPRGCGEHGVTPHGCEHRGRFIPAGAGNTRRTSSASSPRSVHPRGCGEHGLPKASWISIDGSSPRVRGTLQVQGASCALCRFIPAGAGNTATGPRSPSALPVHPRGCGEHRGR